MLTKSLKKIANYFKLVRSKQKLMTAIFNEHVCKIFMDRPIDR